MKNPGEISYIDGGIAIDDRGSVSFNNSFNFQDVRRFYYITNHKQQFVRAWHGHKIEAKFITVVSGSAIVAAVKVDDWENPDPEAEVHRRVLSAAKPGILYIPAGYANGHMSLCDNTILMVFSTTSLEESLDDDYRFPSRHWDIWEVEER
jgi:dTDP-4-dehydrorhamnose 3,5-epimerase-like enzyme